MFLAALPFARLA